MLNTQKSMKSTIRAIFNQEGDPISYQPHPLVYGRSLVGVEVELEGLYSMDSEVYDDLMNWNTIEDGSLRDSGYEFVLRKPKKGQRLIEALEELEKFIQGHSEESGDVPKTSRRTSMHVHIDCRNLTGEQVVNFYMLFTILERTFFRVYGGDDGGSSRINSNYTSPSFRSNKASTLSRMMTESQGAFSEAVRHSSKYSALSLRTLSGIGTVEARLHRAVWKKDEMLLWINTLLLLKEYVVNNELDHESVTSTISMEGIDNFLMRLFGGHADVVDGLISHETPQEIMDGMRYVQDMILEKRKEGVHRGLLSPARGRKPNSHGFLNKADASEEYCLYHDIDFEGNSFRMKDNEKGER